MRAGSRPHLVTLQRGRDTRSATNARVKVFEPIGQAWVAFAAPRGGETYTDGAKVGQRIVRLTGDALELADVQISDRVLMANGQVVDITAVLPGQDARADVVLEGVQGDGVRA